MIAIPVEQKSDLNYHSSELFGNATHFALYKAKDYSFDQVIVNEKSGDGLGTAKFLLDQGVKKALYRFLGTGLFHALDNGGCEVYYIENHPSSTDALIASIKENQLIRVTKANAKTYLDPGTATGNCACGTHHE